MPLRLLARAAPFVLGAVAAALWLRRRQVERPALPPGREAGPEAPEAAPAAPEAAPAAVAPPAPEAAPPAPEAAPPASRTRRFGRRPVDIVAVVDDLLRPAR